MNLIKQIRLPGGRTTTNLGLGCAGLLRIPTRRGRETLLRTAFEEGVTHFDVARMYGLGHAEGILGAALKSFRDQVTVATKFGLPYTMSTGGGTGMQSIARWLFNRSPALKNALKKLSAKAPSPSHQPAAPNNYSIEELEKSLALSLQELQRDQIDILFLHAPGIDDIIAENMGEALQQKKSSGQIGAFGISGYRAELEHYLKTRLEVCGDAIQYHYSPLKSGKEGQPLSYAFTGMFSVIDGTLEPLSKFLSANQSVAKTWSEQLSLELKSRENIGIILLAIALTLNPQGVVLFFTSRPERLRRIVRQLRDNSFTEANLLAFRDAVIRGMHAH
jgi:aryl-alcohol dehydrogenase-like predicted oxidoreductase